MTPKNSNYQYDVLNSSSTDKLKNKKIYLVLYLLKRISYYITLVYGALTFLFLLSFFFPGADEFEIVVFFLYFSLVMFIIYGAIIYSIHLLQKSYIKAFKDESSELKINPDLANNLLQGKTLQVYWYIFTHDEAGIREIQKALNFTSSGTVSYQITKLLNAGIITKDESEGKYVINKEIKIGVLKFFIRIGNRMIPRISLYLIIYALGITAFLFLMFLSDYIFVWNPLNILLLLLLFVGIIIFCVESYRIWKLNPTK